MKGRADRIGIFNLPVCPLTNTSDKSKMVALILCIFLGPLGVHYFYVGRIGRGVVALFTLDFFLIGWIFDIIKIATGGFRDNVGAPLRQ